MSYSKMNLVYTNCIQLLPASSENSLGRLKVSLQAWQNHNKIERAISDLKDEVNKCCANFALFTVLRIDARVSCMPHMPVSDQNVIALAGSTLSTSMPILTTLSNIENDVISAKYLRIQIASIKSIADSLTQLSRMDLCSIPETIEYYILPFKPLLDSSFLLGDWKNLHRDVVARSLEILNILKNEPTEVSIQKGTWDFVNLAIRLHHLYMHEEAAAMGQCTMNLFWTLVSVDEATYTPYLIHSLKHLSRFYEDISNLEEAFPAIEEATRLSRALQSRTTPVQLRIQYGGTLTTYAWAVSLKMDHARAIGLAEEAVKLLEEILQIDNIPYDPCTKINGIAEVNQDFLVHLIQDSGASIQAICNYARALHQLLNCLSDGGRPQESLNPKLRALSILQIMSGLHTESTLDVELAGILFELISHGCKLLPPERLLGYAEKCITIYRKYTETGDATLYRSFLCDSLSLKANILKEMEREDEMLEVWKEVAELAKLVEDPMYLADILYQVSWSFRRLKRHNEAASTRTESIAIYQSLIKTSSSVQAQGCYDLSVDLWLAGRFQEAVQAAQNAVTQYRALAFEDPDTWTKEIGRGLNALTDSYLSAGYCNNMALDNSYEAMSLFEKLISTDPTIIHSYVYCLRVNFSVAFTSDNESRAIELSKDILRHFRALCIKYPKEVALGVWDAELELGQNLNRLNLITKARNHVEELLSKLDDKTQCVEEADTQVVNLHIKTLILYAKILDSQGYPELALTPISKAIEIGTSLSASNSAIASQTVGAMYHHAQLLSILGRNAESLEVGLKTLAFARIKKLDNPGEFVGSLHAVALAAVKNHKPDIVVEVAQEAVDICRGPAMQKYIKINRRALFLLPQSLGFLADGLSTCGEPAEGLVHAQSAVEEAIKLKSVPRLSWADAEPVYMSTRDCLVDIFLDNGNIADAIDLLVDLRKYYSERVKARSGVYAQLVRTLRRLGILYCSVGRHEDGISAADELSRLYTQLTAVFPSLVWLIDFDMMGTLRKADLKCHHQYTPLELEGLSMKTKE